MESDAYGNAPQGDGDIANWIVDFLNTPVDSETSSASSDESVLSVSNDNHRGSKVYDGLEKYREAVSCFFQANASENRDLLNKWRDFSNSESMTRLIEGNLHIVLRIADFYKHVYPQFDEQDFISLGYLGLKSAVEHYKSEEGAPFNSYASYWVKQAIQRYVIGNHNIVYIPPATRIVLQKLALYLSETGIHVNSYYQLSSWHVKEITRRLQISERLLSWLFRIPLATQLDFSLFFLSDRGKPILLSESCFKIPAEVDELNLDSEEKILFQALYNSIAKLDARERAVICLRYGLAGNHTCTLRDIALKIGRTKERVRQIEVDALKKLKFLLKDIYRDFRQTYPKRTYEYHSFRIERIFPEKRDIEIAIYEILDSEVFSLSLQEIQQRLKILFPRTAISDSIILAILSRTTYKRLPHFRSSVSWAINDVDHFSWTSQTMIDKKIEKCNPTLEKVTDLDILSKNDISDEMQNKVYPEGNENAPGDAAESDNLSDDILKMFLL